jgi:hypothetical protein
MPWSLEKPLGSDDALNRERFALRMPLLLFEDKERDDPAPKRAAENSFQFIDRVDDPAFARVRELFNAWVTRFASLQGDKATNDLLGRFRSKPDDQFYSAFWELYLHEVHVRLGFTVRVHPESDRGTRPDFSLLRDGRSFYLEAVMPTPSSGEPQQPGNVQTVMEYIDSARHPDFFLALRFIAPNRDTPRKREVVHAVEGWLSSLNWDEWWRGGLCPEIAYPEAEVPVRGWLLGLRALPRSPERRGGALSRMIGMYPTTTGFPDSVAEAIKPTLDEKANKYGDLDAPYVVAVWTMSAMASEDTAAQALFGIEMPLEAGSHRTGLPSPAQRDALWSPARQHRGRASAVLAATSWDFNYSSVARVWPRLWANPGATRALDQQLPYPTTRVSEDETSIENTPATTEPSAVLELPTDWPGRPFERL